MRRARRRAGDAGLGVQEIAERGAALAADFFVRHHGDGRELVGYDRQHALLGGGGGAGPLAARFGAFAVPAGSYAGDAVGGPARFSPHDRAWRGHGDVGQLRRGGRCGALGDAPVPTAPSTSQLAPPTWKARFFLNLIVPIDSAECDGPIPICLLRRRAICGVAISLRRRRSIDHRKRVARGAGTAARPELEVSQLGIGHEVQQFERLRQQQQRRSARTANCCRAP